MCAPEAPVPRERAGAPTAAPTGHILMLPEANGKRRAEAEVQTRDPGKWGAHRQPFEEFLVNLLNVKDGGTIDTPGGMQMAFPPNRPQLISTNRKFDEWIEDFKKFPIELQHAVAKRIVFFTLPDTPLVKGELRKRKREDERSAVEEGEGGVGART